MQVIATAAQPPEIATNYQDRNHGPDKGLLNAYVAGMKLAQQNKDVANKALQGELPVLPYKGGFEKAIKIGKKYGPLLYLAMWHGLRGDDLNINTEQEYTLTCSATGMTGIYTPNSAMWADA